MRLSEPRFQAVAQDVRRLQNRCSTNRATLADALTDTTKSALAPESVRGLAE
jgi:hypothetical protein